MQTYNITARSLVVNWSEIAEIDQNGNIIVYEIRLIPLNTFDGHLETDYLNTTNSSSLEVMLDNLQEYVQYSVGIRAYTSVGAGPFSPELVQRTLEDGKSFIYYYKSKCMMQLLGFQLHVREHSYSLATKLKCN